MPPPNKRTHHIRGHRMLVETLASPIRTTRTRTSTMLSTLRCRVPIFVSTACVVTGGVSGDIIMQKSQFAVGRLFERPRTHWFTEDDMPLRARKRKTTSTDPSGASDENSFTAAAKSLLTRVKTLLASSGRPVVSLPIDAGVTSELTELFVRMAEQWATITDDHKDAFDTICFAIQRDPCDMRRLVWKQRFHRTPAAESCDHDTIQDPRCQLCGAEVNTPCVCPKAPPAVAVWKPRPEEVIWIHGENRPPYRAIATIAGEVTPHAPAPVYRKLQSGIVALIDYALRARDRIDECIRRWPQYEPLPNHPKTCANE